MTIDNQRIGKYDLVAKIGEGAMGEVHKAHDPVLNRHVAVKTMSALLTADEDLVQRFRREAQSAARLNHPNIVTIFDFAEDQGKFYMAMELLEGEDLKDIIARNGLSDLWDKVEVMEQICDGLAFAHAQGVVHRDLKPANIRILPNGRVKIMDFGLARLDTSDMTRAGMVMGTPNYMSPEQVRGLKADQRSDIFSLGAVFYELLSGHKAFHAPSMHSVLFKVLEERPDPVLNLVPGLPLAFVQLVDKALEKEPERRYQNATELRVAVRGVREALARGDQDGVLNPADAAAATLYSVGEATMVQAEATSPRLRGTVTGANALDLGPTPAPRTAVRSRPPTLSGQAATHGGGRVAPEPPPRSRWPLYLAGALLLVAVVIGAGFLALRRESGQSVQTLPPADIEMGQVGILTEELVRSQVEAARVSLDNKDYRGAIAEAESALKVDPNNAEANELVRRARAVLQELDTTARDARAAFSAGDTARASRALSRVLAIDPRHSVVAELSTALNEHFRSQAQEARGDSMEARKAAVSQRAESFGGFPDGDRLLREADTLAQGGQFTVAAQKFVQARDEFERARRASEAAARQAAARVVPSVVPTTTLIARVLPPPTLPPVVVAPPVTQAPGTQPPPTQAPVGQAEEPAVRRVIADYGRAIESKDLALFRTVKPNLSSDEAKRLQDAFKAIKSQQVGITVESVQIDGGQAVVRVARQDTINGKAVQRVQQTFRLAQGPGGWAIVSIGQ
jgi:tetratricopeptide (TPR) repeat protein